MKRFLMLVGVAVVAAAMYVAASPASQQSKGPSEKQFLALEKKVTAQGKTIKTLKTLAAVEVTFFTDCVGAAIPIDQFGNPTGNPAEGYHYLLPSNNPQEILTTGLDVSDSSDTGALYITGGTASCSTLVNGSGLRHLASKAGVALPRASHRWSFAAHQK
jgi:hypothetical protein